MTLDGADFLEESGLGAVEREKDGHASLAWVQESASTASKRPRADQAAVLVQFESTNRAWVRTSDMAERLHREVKRRSKVASLFRNEASVLRLVTAIHIPAYPFLQKLRCLALEHLVYCFSV